MRGRTVLDSGGSGWNIWMVCLFGEGGAWKYTSVEPITLRKKRESVQIHTCSFIPNVLRMIPSAALYAYSACATCV